MSAIDPGPNALTTALALPNCTNGNDPPAFGGGAWGGGSGSTDGGSGDPGRGCVGDCSDIVITAPRPLPPPPPPPPPIPQLTLASGPTEHGDYCSLSPDTPGGIDISEACRQHDECYATGDSRSQCDLQLGTDIYDSCRRQGGDRGNCFALAETYYLAVRGFGVFFWIPSRRN